MPVTFLDVKLGDRTVHVQGRQAWALNALIEAGEKGVTPITHPGPRWSDYVFKLRREGFLIETENENHTGAYPGHHARYRLLSPVVVLDRKHQDQAKGRAA